MNYKKWNNLMGWAVFGIAAIVYISTMETQGSFWDCGEFASTAARMGVPHPPGAPLFIMIGRMFALIGKAVGLGEAGGVALLSALSSAFTILFTFWIITHFARKIKLRQGAGSVAIEGDTLGDVDEGASDEKFDSKTIFEIMAAGVVGALAYTFSDSFWYSAVEPEVYALSSFFTAIVIWAALKWEDHPENNAMASQDGRNRADKWMILIFFLMGLSIGVHLLNILTIPPILLLFYFKRYKATNKGMITALAVSIFVLGFVQKFVGQWSIGIAFQFDKFFVNSIGLPPTSGFFFFFALLGVGLFLLLRLAHKGGYGMLRLSIWCLIFTFIGMSSYVTTMIRAAAQPGVNMYNVSNPHALQGYLSREQYGDFPLLKGQHYEAIPIDNKETGTKYLLRKDENGKLRYKEVGHSYEQIYAPEDMMFFPRIWYGSEKNRKEFYSTWLNPKKEVYDQRTGEGYEVFDTEREAELAVQKLNTNSNGAAFAVRDKLGQKENWNWFFSYQMNWMYWRYFFWNFAGRQNDIQGFSSKRDGNWISGIPFIDNIRLGNQNNNTDALKKNKANNKYYLLPFALGVIGFIYSTFRKNKATNKTKASFLNYVHEDGWVILLLFIMTGLAIVIYLNQYGLQPRERDYAYVGSFNVFCIWIGLGVMQVTQWLRVLGKNILPAAVASALCFVAVPGNMAKENWDDHDRSKKTLAKDLAKSYLNSCPENAMLFTVGDNDTYPLWFAQEVLGIRKDVRVVNTSLLGIDWYLDQLRYKVNNSAPFKMVWDSTAYEGTSLDVVYNVKRTGNTSGLAATYSLYDFIKECSKLNAFPGNNYYIETDLAKAGKIFNLQPGDSLSSRIDLTIPEGRNYLTKSDLGVLNVVAANISDRPICFTDNYGEELGFLPYLRREGMVYRFMPSKQFSNIELDKTIPKMLDDKSFGFGNAASKKVYFDEENRRHLESIRMCYVEYAKAAAQNGRIEDAKKLLKKIYTEIPAESLPYGCPSRGESLNNTSLRMVEACYLAKEETMAKEIYAQVTKDMEQQYKYYKSLASGVANPSKQEVDSYKAKINEFEDLPNQRPTTQAEADAISRKYEALQKEILGGKAGGFTSQDLFGLMRNARLKNEVDKRFINPPAPAVPNSGSKDSTRR